MLTNNFKILLRRFLFPNLQEEELAPLLKFSEYGNIDYFLNNVHPLIKTNAKTYVQQKFLREFFSQDYTLNHYKTVLDAELDFTKFDINDFVINYLSSDNYGVDGGVLEEAFSKRSQAFLLLGDGTEKEDVNNIDLSHIITSYDIVSEDFYSDILTYSSSLGVFCKTIQNNNNYPITISEIGLYMNIFSLFLPATYKNESFLTNIQSFKTNPVVLLAREVLQDSVVLMPGEKHTFNLDIKLEEKSGLVNNFISLLKIGNLKTYYNYQLDKDESTTKSEFFYKYGSDKGPRIGSLIKFPDDATQKILNNRFPIYYFSFIGKGFLYNAFDNLPWEKTKKIVGYTDGSKGSVEPIYEESFDTIVKKPEDTTKVVGGYKKDWSYSKNRRDLHLFLGKSNKKESFLNNTLDFIDSYTIINMKLSPPSLKNKKSSITLSIKNETEEDIVIKELGLFLNDYTLFSEAVTLIDSTAYNRGSLWYNTGTDYSKSGLESYRNFSVCFMIARKVLNIPVRLKSGEGYTFSMTLDI